MKDIDFLEIGTSNFNTLIQTCSENETGISIEPSLYYLEQLPNKKNVKKIHAAITDEKKSNTVKFFYIPEQIILKNNLQEWFKGTNTINNYHPLHIIHKVQHLVTIDEVPLKTFEDIYLENELNFIKFIKIDTEGHDCKIMNSIYEFYKDKNKNIYPKKIQFESNEWSTRNEVDNVIFKFKNIGYELFERSYDTILTFGEKSE